MDADEGGDPACWLHLFEDELSDDRPDAPENAPPAEPAGLDEPPAPGGDPDS